MASQPSEGNLEESFSKSFGRSVDEISRLRSGSYAKSKKGTLLRSADAAWYVFDDLSCAQAEDLLGQHGNHGTYLVAHFHQPESYGISIKLDDGTNNIVYKHYAIGTANQLYHTEGIPGDFPSIEAVVEAIGLRLSLKLIPIFHKFNEDTTDFEITMSEEDERPPDYSQASRFPNAARRPLPLIVPVHPTLRRMLRQPQSRRGTPQDVESPLGTSLSGSGDQPLPHHGCCWKAFHTDPAGRWYKPHKAGPITGCILLVGWVLFLVLFGWIVGLALLLVILMLACACLYNYICTGRCELGDDGDEEVIVEGAQPGEGTPLSSRYNGMPQHHQQQRQRR